MWPQRSQPLLDRPLLPRTTNLPQPIQRSVPVPSCPLVSGPRSCTLPHIRHRQKILHPWRSRILRVYSGAYLDCVVPDSSFTVRATSGPPTRRTSSLRRTVNVRIICRWRESQAWLGSSSYGVIIREAPAFVSSISIASSSWGDGCGARGSARLIEVVGSKDSRWSLKRYRSM